MEKIKLDDLKNKSAFKVPDGYFEGFPQRLQNKIYEKPVVALYKKPVVWYAAAAVLVIALLLPLTQTSTAETSVDAVTIENYLALQSDFTQYELLSLLESDDIAQLDQQLPIDDFVIEENLLTYPNIEQLIIEQP